MSSYLTYMTAVSSDLRQIPVWEPGAATALGDYGEIRNKQWQRLGSIWDRLPEVSPGLRDESTAHLELMCRGSSEVCNGGASLSHDGSVGTLGLSIRFSKGNSVFLRAQACETRSLRRLHAIAQHLVLYDKEWQKHWSIVSEVQTAERFLVIVCGKTGGQVEIRAKSRDVLDALIAGHLEGNANLQISGTDIVQFVGKNGPITMSLFRVRSTWLGKPEAIPQRLQSAHGEAQSDPAEVDEVKAEAFMNEIAAANAEENPL